MYVMMKKAYSRKVRQTYTISLSVCVSVCALSEYKQWYMKSTKERYQRAHVYIYIYIRIHDNLSDTHIWLVRRLMVVALTLSE